MARSLPPDWSRFLQLASSCLLVLCLQGCQATQEQTTVKKAASRPVAGGRHGKPSDKDVILMVMQNNDIPLAVDASCSGVGTALSDQTIGEFLSGFWQYHEDSSCRNQLKIAVTEGTDTAIKEKFWEARMMINGQTEHENWSWGVSFYVLDRNQEVVRSSFRCLGAG